MKENYMRHLGLRAACPLIVLAVAVVLAPVTTWAQSATENFILHDSPRSLPEMQFKDGEGRNVSLADFHGKVVLLNIWATWCVPCLREMPTLDRLQAQLVGPDFEVVALSIDRAGLKVVQNFYEKVGIQHLAMYIDSSGKAVRNLGISGLPTTFLIDRAGRELGRLIGPADSAAASTGEGGDSACSCSR